MRQPTVLVGDEDGLTLRTEVRVAAWIALGGAAILLPVQLGYLAADVLPALLAIYGVHTLLVGAVLVASYGRFGRQHADRLALALIGGLVANLLVYLYLLPFAVPTYPSLISNALTCVLIGGAVLFSWSVRRMLVMSLATCAGFVAVAIAMTLRGYPGGPFWLPFGWLVIGAVLAVVCARELGRFRERLLRRQEELAALSARLIAGQEEQLHQLSRELHDELGQALTAVSSNLWLLERRVTPELREQTTEARHLVSTTLGQMRELSRLLRPPVLDLQGLAASLEQHLELFAGRHGIRTEFRADGVPERLPEAIETAIYRIAQEALTNVARHSRATRVNVTLEASNGTLAMAVEDDGQGLDAARASTSGGVGLIGIRERVRALGGTMILEGRPSACLLVRVPLAPPS